jgi:hypothetical protein
MTKIKDLIVNCIKYCTDLKDKIRLLKQSENADEIIVGLNENLSNSNFNPVLLIELAQQLQLSDNHKIFEQYDLDDISKLFRCLIELQEDNLIHYTEAASFEWAVRDDSAKALNIIDEGLLIARNRIVDLENLKNKILE